jgi:putative long chain acyl-CoA synthase
MVSVGSALVSGARLALAEGFSPDTFWNETRRYGATVVFYAGEMCRQLVDSPHHRGQSTNPIRLFAGSGMRVDVWHRLVERFGPVGVLEFYAATETMAVLANASGKKEGAVGSPMPGSSPMSLLRFDLLEGALVRGSGGYCIPCPPQEAGLMVTKIRPAEAKALRSSRVLRSVFTPKDYWFVERIDDLVATSAGHLLCLPIEDLLYGTGRVSLAAAYGVEEPTAGEQVLIASLVPLEGHDVDAKLFDELFASIDEAARPWRVLVVAALPMSDGFRPIKSYLRADGLPDLEDSLQTYQYNPKRHRYEQL